MKKSYYLLIALVVVGVFVLIYYSGSSSGNYNEFADCLTSKGVKMFGAYWCSHCAEQKKLFSGSFDKINYVECSLPNAAGQTQECTAEGIRGYPTWQFSDGSRAEGTVSLEELSQRTGCVLP